MHIFLWLLRMAKNEKMHVPWGACGKRIMKLPRMPLTVSDRVNTQASASRRQGNSTAGPLTAPTS